jgi:RNA polymerase sigma-70 factor (ECF subfamily)
MYAVCFRMVRDPDSARDLTQDTLVKVIQGFDSFDARARLSTWMTRIAMNVCLSHLRKQRLRRHASLETAGAGGADREGGIGNGLPQGREPSAASRVEGGEAREFLLRAMERIDPEHRAVLTLRDLQGMDYREVAETLDVPVGTVKSRLFRARAALREAVEALGWKGGVDESSVDEREVDR